MCVPLDLSNTAACRKKYLERMLITCDKASERCETLYDGLDVDFSIRYVVSRHDIFINASWIFQRLISIPQSSLRREFRLLNDTICSTVYSV